MWHFLTCLAVFAMGFDAYVLNFLALPSEILHKLCVEQAPVSSSYSDLYAAMVCGQSLQPQTLTEDLRTLGLYHLLVVSGAHFLFLEWLLTRFSFRRRSKTQAGLFFLLSAYAATCQWSAPVMRAWWSFLLRKTTEEQKLFWRGPHITFFSGLLCLGLRPEWISSISFQLSWLAALLLATAPPSQRLRHLWIYLGLMPALYSLQTLHPLTSLTNAWLAPFFSVVLFPLCLLTLVFQFLTPLTDAVWECLARVSRPLANVLETQPASTSPSPALALWLYILTLHFLVLWRMWHRGRTL